MHDGWGSTKALPPAAAVNNVAKIETNHDKTTTMMSVNIRKHAYKLLRRVAFAMMKCLHWVVWCHD